MTNSRTKGSRNERGVAKLMQDWSGYEFARTPQSGGLHWKKSHTTGDIVCIDDKHGFRFAFSIECKFHADLDLLHLIDDTIGKKSNKILFFWEQCLRDATTSKKVPLLFMRRNGMKKDMHFVVISTYFFQIWLKEIEPWDNSNGLLHYFDGAIDITILNSEDLFKTHYSAFHRAGRRLMKQQYGTNMST